MMAIMATRQLRWSSRGPLQFQSSIIRPLEVILYEFIPHPADLPRLLEGLRLADEAARHPALAGLTGGRRLGPPPEAIARDDVATEWIRNSAWTYHHPIGTCAMGLDPAAGAVGLDPDARVYGVDGLSVADASILPEIPSANTNIPVIMVAEHVAARRRLPDRSVRPPARAGVPPDPFGPASTRRSARRRCASTRRWRTFRQTRSSRSRTR